MANTGETIVKVILAVSNILKEAAPLIKEAKKILTTDDIKNVDLSAVEADIDAAFSEWEEYKKEVLELRKKKEIE